MWLLILALGLGLFLYMKRKSEGKGKIEIPGPRGLPLVGNLHQFKPSQHKVFNKWQEEFGDIYKVNMAVAKLVVVSDPKIIKELFLYDRNYIGRPAFTCFYTYENEQIGVGFSEGDIYDVHRRFLVRQLRQFGFGRASMEELILEELNELIDRFKRDEGKPVKDIKKITTSAAINTMWVVLCQKRYKHDDPKLTEFAELADKVFYAFSKNHLILFPWLRHIAPELSGYKEVRYILDEFKKWVEDEVAEHKRTFQEDNLRDFVDAFLAEKGKTEDPKSLFYGEQAERQLVSTIADMFFAGQDTTATTLAWAIFFICKFPKVQKKFQDEIEKITGNLRFVGVADRQNMPYSVALIDEILRFSTIVPNAVPHRAVADKVFRDIFIPKDTLIVANLHFLHHNPKIWGDPENFRPERFLSKDGLVYKRNENLMAFSIGRRQCPGEPLARDLIFLLLTNILQRFDIKFDPNQKEPGLYDLSEEVTIRPDPYAIIMKDRLQA